MRQSLRLVPAFACACAAAFASGVHAETTLNMQATWPASLTLYENFIYFADRISKVSGGELKINAMPAGQVVPAFEVLDATHKKVLESQRAYASLVVPAKRFMFPPYSFVANYYWPEDRGGRKK